MYIEDKSGELEGPGRIGWVTMSKSMRSYNYNGRRFQKVKGGYKYNCVAADNGDTFWISGPKKDGTDRLYGGIVEIDEDAREEYWTSTRNLPASKHLAKFRC